VHAGVEGGYPLTRERLRGQAVQPGPHGRQRVERDRGRAEHKQVRSLHIRGRRLFDVQNARVPANAIGNGLGNLLSVPVRGVVDDQCFHVCSEAPG